MPPPADDDAEVFALLAEEFFMTEGQVLLRSDAAGARTADGISFPPDGLARRVGPERARRVAELQREIAERLDAHPAPCAAFRDRAERASPEELAALHREMAHDPFFRGVTRRAIGIFFLFYPTWESYVRTVHPGAAAEPDKHPKEAEETRAHYRRMEAARAWLADSPSPASE